MALRSLPWRVKQPAPRIKAPDTAGGRNASHYQSEAHRKWAAAVKHRDRWTCQKCGATGRDVRLVADHIVEINDGGDPLNIANGTTLCQPCHNRKTRTAAAERLFKR